MGHSFSSPAFTVSIYLVLIGCGKPDLIGPRTSPSTSSTKVVAVRSNPVAGVQAAQLPQDRATENPTVLVEEQKGCGVVSSSFEGTGCLQIGFAGEVSANHRFEKSFGGLLFRLNPEGAQSGWIIEVVSAARTVTSSSDSRAEHVDYVWVVNPPYHGRNTSYLDTSYGVNAAEAVKSSPYDFNFVLNHQQYEEASQLVEKAIMSRPQTDRRSQEEVARESDEATERLLTRFPVSKGRLVILDSRIANAGNFAEESSIEWLKFRVSLRVPCSLDVPSEVSGISVDRAGCPAASRAGKSI